MAASPGTGGCGFATPSMRPPELPARLLDPTVEFVAAPGLEAPVDPVDAVPGMGGAEPEEFAVPTVFVPGASGTFVELPAPLGSLTELLSPPALAGPFGTPLMAAVPAPAAPAFGVPTEPAVPAVDPMAAPVAVPPVEAPPVEAPPAAPPLLALPPELAPPQLPPLCANAASGPISAIITTNLQIFKLLISAPFLITLMQFRSFCLVPSDRHESRCIGCWSRSRRGTPQRLVLSHGKITECIGQVPRRWQIAVPNLVSIFR